MFSPKKWNNKQQKHLLTKQDEFQGLLDTEILSNVVTWSTIRQPTSFPVSAQNISFVISLSYLTGLLRSPPTALNGFPVNCQGRNVRVYETKACRVVRNRVTCADSHLPYKKLLKLFLPNLVFRKKHLGNWNSVTKD
jgi:hypothetical protein